MNGFGDYKPSEVGGSKAKGLQGCYRPYLYQDRVGTIAAKMEAGYCGQDAYSNMFVVEVCDGA